MKQILLILLLSPLFTDAQVIVTAAGGGIVLGDGGPATAAELNGPWGVNLDGSGNLYICDVGNSRIRKVSPGYGGPITTIAGNGTFGYSGDGGLGIFAQLNNIVDVFVDRNGNVYVVDQGNNCIRKITLADTITTVAGTGTAGYNGDGVLATAAQLNNPYGVTVDSIGDIYITDAGNYRIRMVDTAGIIHTIAGTGVAGFSPDGSLADTAKIIPWCIRIDNTGEIYYGDSFFIRKINPVGFISTIAGNGMAGSSGDGNMATTAEIGGGGGIGIDMSGNLYIADASNYRIRKVNIEDGIINTVVGNGIGGFSGDGGSPLLAKLNNPIAVALDDSGDIYISDNGNNRIRLVTNHLLSVSNILQNNESISIYPNPCNDYCIIEISSGINEQSLVSITNAAGIKIKKFVIPTNQLFIIQPDWPPGVYIIKATTLQQQFYQKIVIQ